MSWLGCGTLRIVPVFGSHTAACVYSSEVEPGKALGSFDAKVRMRPSGRLATDTGTCGQTRMGPQLPPTWGAKLGGGSGGTTWAPAGEASARAARSGRKSDGGRSF